MFRNKSGDKTTLPSSEHVNDDDAAPAAPAAFNTSEFTRNMGMDATGDAGDRKSSRGGGKSSATTSNKARPSYRTTAYDKPAEEEEEEESQMMEDHDDQDEDNYDEERDNFNDNMDDDNLDNEDHDQDDEHEDEVDETMGDNLGDMPSPMASKNPADNLSMSVVKAKNIAKSAGTSRLNRILSKSTNVGDDESRGGNFSSGKSTAGHSQSQGQHSHGQHAHGQHAHGQHQGQQQQQHSLHHFDNHNRKVERVQDPHNTHQVGEFCARLVVPPLKVDPCSIGGSLLEAYPVDTMQQETLLCFECQSFESTGTESIVQQALQYPTDYKKHKRSLLGLFGGMGTKGRNKLRYVLVARSTNRPLLAPTQPSNSNRLLLAKEEALAREKEQETRSGDNAGGEEGSVKDDYDAMFVPEDDSMSKDMSMESSNNANNVTSSSNRNIDPNESIANNTANMNESSSIINIDDKTRSLPSSPSRKRVQIIEQEEEISSFPVLICLTLHSDGTAPDIRKLAQLDQLTTVQDLHSTVVQLAFSSGDTVRLNFGGEGQQEDEEKTAEAAMCKERFIWSLLQVHAMLCVSVVERNSMETTGGVSKERMCLPPLNVRNLDRAELQYVATVNGFLRSSETLCVLLDRQRSLHEEEAEPTTALVVGAKDASSSGGLKKRESKEGNDEMDAMAYDLMMGNFATRVTLFHSEEERKDAEEILNSTEWTEKLSKEETAAISVAERLGLMLQWRMRDLEAETCRRLIAWEDEKHHSAKGKSTFFGKTDERDTVDALALASLFKTLESLDLELQLMEDWLQDRAIAIKPLTDDCADIEEENRQLEQQWKSYDMLGAEMRRLLQGLEIEGDVEKILKNPASALLYDEDGLVDVDSSEPGLEQIYDAGKALQEAMEYPKRCGGLHLKAVAERSAGLSLVANNFCNALAQIIVTVMEQSKTEVVAGSDYGKVSKSDTHGIIAKKIRDTQRKFQSAMLGYIKLIEILASLSPEMLPALRDAYSEMVSEGILMKKRMKGYFQSLPGKNAAYMNKAGKDLKDYVPFDNSFMEENVSAPDIRHVLSELLPVIAREAYFTSALFGVSGKEQDGREKKRNFENTRNAVDNSSQHYRYYVERTCGIVPFDSSGKSLSEMGVKGDPMLCSVASIYLNEAMDSYIDREKKGGDHSLSLAYVRATILDLRKKADKQWVVWVDKQIEWIRSNDGVPLNGKRAGVFPSFARFPCYLDHLLQCCRDGRDPTYSPDIINIKVISYYLQKIAVALLESLQECATRESTDQQYASNVMKMENAYFYSQAIKARGPTIADLFAKQVLKANAICKESTDAYLGWMIKREFTALHELFSRVSKARKDLGDKEVATHVPKSLFVKTLNKEANRVIMKEKIGLMYSRMEKHLCEEGGLLPVAWKALVKVLFEWFGRWEKLSSQIYMYKLDPGAVDIVRIAKAAGGAAKPKAEAKEHDTDFGFKSGLKLLSAKGK